MTWSHTQDYKFLVDCIMSFISTSSTPCWLTMPCWLTAAATQFDFSKIPRRKWGGQRKIKTYLVSRQGEETPLLYKIQKRGRQHLYKHNNVDTLIVLAPGAILRGSSMVKGCELNSYEISFKRMILDKITGKERELLAWFCSTVIINRSQIKNALCPEYSRNKWLPERAKEMQQCCKADEGDSC